METYSEDYLHQILEDLYNIHLGRLAILIPQLLDELWTKNLDPKDIPPLVYEHQKYKDLLLSEEIVETHFKKYKIILDREIREHRDIYDQINTKNLNIYWNITTLLDHYFTLFRNMHETGVDRKAIYYLPETISYN